MKIDLGCGKHKKLNFVGLDIFDYSNIYPKDKFIQHDLTKPWPFQNNEVEEIYTSNNLKHLTPEEFKFVMEEIYRVTKTGSKITIIVPHFSGHSAFRPYHKIYFDINSLMEFTHSKENSGWYISPLFKLTKKKLIFKKRLAYFWNYFFEKFINLSPYFQNFYEESFLKSLFPAYFIMWELRKI